MPQAAVTNGGAESESAGSSTAKRGSADAWPT